MMRSFILLILITVLSACDKTQEAVLETMDKKLSTEPKSHSAKPDNKAVNLNRVMDAAQLERGKALFQSNCAVCHGENAQGVDNWHQTNADGKFPPPPLNGTGHAWHHKSALLKRIIKDGTQKLGGSMPGWKGKLNDQDIDDILAWLQSMWPDEIYAVWHKIEKGDN